MFSYRKTNFFPKSLARTLVLAMFFEKNLLFLKENIGFWRSQAPSQPSPASPGHTTREEERGGERRRDEERGGERRREEERRGERNTAGFSGVPPRSFGSKTPKVLDVLNSRSPFGVGGFGKVGRPPSARGLQPACQKSRPTKAGSQPN